MQFNEYQNFIKKFDMFSDQKGDMKNPAFIAKIFGLSGEAGEVCEKFKKILRDKKGEITDQDKSEIKKELGDVLWYIATISRYLDIELEDVADTNINKLTKRLKENRLHGSGDNR